MKRNNLTRLIIVILLVVWSLYEIYPPTGRDLVEWFGARAHNKDADFSKILTQAQTMEKTNAARAYGNLQDAIGTNDIIHYFPSFDAQEDPHPTEYILNRLQREAAGKVHLGLDLQGGISFTMRMNTNALMEAQSNTNKVFRPEDINMAIKQAVEVLRKRVDKLGVAEPVLQPEGADRILVQLPGLSEEHQKEATVLLSKPAYLEFKLVHEHSEELLAQGVIEPGYEVLTEVDELKNGQKRMTKYLVNKHAEMVGGVKDAGLNRDNMGNPRIVFTLDSAGAERFGQITRANVGRRLAIVLDGELKTAPNINSPIEGGSGEITGSYTDQQASEIANVLQNPLKAPLAIISSSLVDPTLGNDSIHSGIKAALIGVILVAGFMLVYYMLAGAVANTALMLNIIILMGVMCSVGTTLTMPGIAGVVLTIGMAVDANVLIFERIREESAKGKSLRGALEAGYDRAFSTILDSHVTTLISSIILIFMGTGSVKGFGVTLTIGVAASLFTALVVTRLIFDWLLAKNLIKKINMLHLIKGTKIDFMRWALPAFIASWLLIAIGIGYGFHRGHDVLGVEFAGGDTVKLAFDPAHKVDVDKLREAATKATGGDALVSYQHDVAGGNETLSITVRDFGKGEGTETINQGQKVVSQLQQEFPESMFVVRGIDHVGATVSGELSRAAILASLLAMFGILVYVAFRYEFSFAVGAVVAIIHDVLMTLGWYFLAGRELNATTVAAVLTIIGFSINDTVVIFDRIREDLKLGVRGSFKDIVNQALNQTLSRTLITSGTVFLATLSLYVFGGGVINDFAFAFLVGILTGTYSSIYIASSLVIFWQWYFHNGQRPGIGGPQTAASTTAVVAGK